MSQTLRFGDRSAAVRDLQRKLNAKGAKLTTDGAYGAATETAVRAYQRAIGLVADGWPVPRPSPPLPVPSAAICSRTRTWWQPPSVSASSWPPSTPSTKSKAWAKASCQWSSENSFERHVMYQRLLVPRRGRSQAALRSRADELAAQYPSLINPKPGGYIGGAGEHQRLAQARMIDPVCANESASWGAFQIMGYHALHLGYASVDEFVQLMSRDENQQFEAFIRFIEADSNRTRPSRARSGRRSPRVTTARPMPEPLRRETQTGLRTAPRVRLRWDRRRHE